ncbi:MAG: hypothetical protein ACLTX3_07385 [Lachnospiraceae bacterium]
MESGVMCIVWTGDGDLQVGTITYTGSETSDKICYCLMYGAQYWKQECVWPNYRSGMGWQADYYVTQMALHVVNGEFSLAWFKQVCTNSTIYNAVAKLVNATQMILLITLVLLVHCIPEMNIPYPRPIWIAGLPRQKMA